MINLLPPELKQQYVYGRHNTVLRRWAIAMVFGLLGVSVVTFAGLFLMQKSISDFRSQVKNSSQVLSEQKLDETRQHAKDITASVKLSVDVLSKEIMFSKLITQIGKVTPSNVKLTDLNIGKDQSSIDIKALSADYTSATQLQVNLQDPANKIFSKADIQTVSCGVTTTDSRYPCSITIKALFSENNPFLFINKNGTK
jgi:septation ring formation regulator EzrA